MTNLTLLRKKKMETEGVITNGFGASLPVENVQELASHKYKDIPPRYIRPEIESEEVSVNESVQIPMIDMSKMGEQFCCEEELAKLHLACKDWGFFQLINHGVAEEVIDKMKIDVAEFFKLPLQERQACAQLPNHVEGYGQAFVISEEQKLDWGDMLFLLSEPVSQRNMRFWPNSPITFRASLDKYSSELQKVSTCLLRLMAKNLGIKGGKLVDMFEEGVQAVRMNYYPPCLQANKVMGLNKHSDATGLTLLVQVNEVQGLQIRKDGKWVPVRSIPGAFIVNLGDILEILSNGEYKSIEHRAVVNPEKERLSIAAFHSPSYTATIGPLPEIMLNNGANYKAMGRQEYVKLVMSSKLDGKNLLDSMKVGK